MAKLSTAGTEMVAEDEELTKEDVKNLVQGGLKGATVTEVEDFGDAFAIYFVNDEYLQSGDFIDLQVGAGPVIYIKATGEMFQTGSALSGEDYIEAYRQCGDVFGRPCEKLQISGFAEMADEKKATLLLKAVLGTGMAEAKKLMEKLARDGKIEIAFDSDFAAEEAAEKLSRMGCKVKQLWRQSF